MHVEGALTQWSEDTQTGTITRSDGGGDLPVHIRAFESSGVHPRVGQRVSFDLSHTWDGQSRARKVRLLRGVAVLPLGPQAARAGWLLLLAFAVLALVAAQTWGVPRELILAYLVASIVCATVVAGQHLRPRTWQESALLGLGLVGGWPGTVVAQSLSGHSAFRPGWRSVFILIVLANMAGFVALIAAR